MRSAANKKKNISGDGIIHRLNQDLGYSPVPATALPAAPHVRKSLLVTVIGYPAFTPLRRVTRGKVRKAWKSAYTPPPTTTFFSYFFDLIYVYVSGYFLIARVISATDRALSDRDDGIGERQPTSECGGSAVGSLAV